MLYFLLQIWPLLKHLTTLRPRLVVQDAHVHKPYNNIILSA